MARLQRTIEDGVITNDNPYHRQLFFNKYIIEQDSGRAILFSHLGRVKEADKAGKITCSCSSWLGSKLGQDVVFPGVTRGAELGLTINALEDGRVLLVWKHSFHQTAHEKT